MHWCIDLNTGYNFSIPRVITNSSLRNPPSIGRKDYEELSPLASSPFSFCWDGRQASLSWSNLLHRGSVRQKQTRPSGWRQILNGEPSSPLTTRMSVALPCRERLLLSSVRLLRYTDSITEPAFKAQQGTNRQSHTGLLLRLITEVSMRHFLLKGF